MDSGFNVLNGNTIALELEYSRDRFFHCSPPQVPPSDHFLYYDFAFEYMRECFTQ